MNTDNMPKYSYVVNRDQFVDLRIALVDLIDATERSLLNTGNAHYKNKLESLRELEKQTRYLNLRTVDE